MTCNVFLSELKRGKFWVFGTGYVAETFWYAIQRHGLAREVRGFLVSAPGNDPLFHGVPVRTVSDADIAPNDTVCLAVHESLTGEIHMLLAGITSRAYPVWPFLTELCYGTPLRTEEIPLRSLLDKQDPSYNWLAVRYAVSRDRIGRLDTQSFSENLYLRAMSLHSGSATAERRLASFRRLIDAMSAEGWMPERQAFIEEDGRIIDGLHRVACAAFLGIERIPVMVYPDSPAYDLLLGDNNRLPEHYLSEMAFTTEELAFLRQARKELHWSE